MQKRDLQIFGQNKNNWASQVRNVLDLYGFQEVWTEGVAHTRPFLMSLKNKMVEKFREDWLLKITTSERFSIYSTFKLQHQSEKYLNNITIKKFRDTLVRFRFGINELGVNKRYIMGNVLRTCPFCPDVLEDEHHFLLICPMYVEIRNKYLQPILYEDSTVQSFLLDPSLEISRKIAMFIFYALNHREELLNVN